MAKPIIPLIERLMVKVEKLPNGCWRFTGHLNGEGYGTIQGAKGRMELAHRAMYAHHFGPVPTGMTVDHQCHEKDACEGGKICPHRCCVNPEHLKPMTALDNKKRGHNRMERFMAAGHAAVGAKTHCPKNHEYTPENTRVRTDKRGIRHRICIICARASTAAYELRKKTDSSEVACKEVII